ncbi:hypothetical protein, partial [Flavobacterium sp.]|uniref:hypothetical protein n=1 Tax=Flavobacterium sp. TaxID=239 RepID=UPI0025BB9342
YVDTPPILGGYSGVNCIYKVDLLMCYQNIFINKTFLGDTYLLNQIEYSFMIYTQIIFLRRYSYN